MKNLEKYKGIIPAFYACYDDNGDVSPERTQKLAQYYFDKGIKGLYVGGSSGECIYQNIEERKIILENVMGVVGNKMTIIAHVAAPSTRDSIELAKHAANLGVDALAAIPPIYFTLPEYSIEEYWTEMIQAANIDFLIYNIPQTTGYALTSNLLNKMLENENVIGVKNSSMPVQDILTWKLNSKKDIIVFNGPDEQFVGGRIMGADGGIGGTYGVMPELFLAADKAIQNSNISLATEIQFAITNIIFEMVKAKANLYAIMKKVLEKDGLQLGGVRSPLTNVTDEDLVIVNKVSKMITSSINKYC